MTINLHVVHSGSIAVNLQGGGQDAIAATLNQLLAQGTQIMATLADVQAALANEDTKVDGMIAAFKDAVAKLQAALANGADPAALQALVDDMNAKSAAMDAVNPPAAPADATPAADATPPADGSAPSA